MNVTVLLPGVLRPAAGGAPRFELEMTAPATLGDVLDVIASRYPLLERRLRDEQRRLRRYVNFFVDGEECRRLAGADTPLAEGTEIQIIPSVAGG
ncbi:MoaD/ThiS family protein [Allokutzneria albata]|uniref:Molybdopterin converting factor, small subunit n=1 Tax=Allokutzneria albata TaxID=211114 RepID=A0A1G9WVK8_ALLAB|nr:MoaD/ThiS family protein [Allokutzneria albata]SDM88664.1 Molybdopterin converting factor, small subunit [Allokutzneria albata]